MAVRERRGRSVVLKVSTEMPCPEDAMRQRTGVMERVASEDAPRTQGGGSAAAHAASSAEDAQRSHPPPTPPPQRRRRLLATRPGRGPAADWLRRRAEVMLLSPASRAPAEPRVSAGGGGGGGCRAGELETRWGRGIGSPGALELGDAGA